MCTDAACVYRRGVSGVKQFYRVALDIIRCAAEHSAALEHCDF